MWRVHIHRHFRVRPQLLMGLIAVVVAAWGVHITGTQPVISSVITDRKPQIAGAFTMSLPTAGPTVDCGRQACLALTFDDGPSADITPLVLDALARHHAHATFFVMGTHVAGNEGLLRRMYHEGHEIGNHSWNHPHFPALNPDQIRSQINDTQAAIVRAGVPAPTLLRPPYGELNNAVESAVPMTIALWNVDPEDWSRKKPDDIPPLVEAHAKAGRVVVLHDMHKPTADSLDKMLTDLQKDYALVTFSQLFDIGPGQPGRYYGR